MFKVSIIDKNTTSLHTTNVTSDLKSMEWVHAIHYQMQYQLINIYLKKIIINDCSQYMFFFYLNTIFSKCSTLTLQAALLTSLQCFQMFSVIFSVDLKFVLGNNNKKKHL